jgi:hypothetical protein
MTTNEIAERLVSYCRRGEFETAQRELYSSDAVSLEPEDTPMAPRQTKGLSAIIEKGKRFTSAVEEIHSLKVSDPLVAADSFACTMSLDATMKGRGRTTISELCIYLVADGKVVSEEFHP